MDTKKEGPLYRMRRSPAEYLWVPESVKNGLQTYNWEFYREMVDACLEDRTKRLSDLSENIATDIIQRDGKLMKVVAVPHPEAGKKVLN